MFYSYPKPKHIKMHGKKIDKTIYTINRELGWIIFLN